jgi:phosphoenolpyruvate carboxykinase (GTP)
MMPFCGYDMADHWSHWLRVGASLDPARRPLVFQVNWFRKDDSGRFVWPGFGENARVLAWMVQQVDRSRGLRTDVGAIPSPVGLLPAPGALDVGGLGLDDDAIATLCTVDARAWDHEAELTQEFFAQFGDRVPPALWVQLARLRSALGDPR